MVPQTLAGLERLFAFFAKVGSQVGVGLFVGSDGGRVLELLAAYLASLVHVGGVFEELVFLEVVLLLETDEADFTLVRPVVAVGPQVVLKVRVLGEHLLAHFASPAVRLSRIGGFRSLDERRRTVWIKSWCSGLLLVER